MVVVQINALCGTGSTGKICKSVSELLNEQRVENYVLYSIGKSDYKNAYKYSNFYTQKFYALYSRVFGNNGFNSFTSTKRLINKLNEINPDIIHLHNIHSNDVNLALLFEFIKDKKIKVVWTFHDCWAFTGYCMHFDYIKCTKWHQQCDNCPQRCTYSWFFDRSAEVFGKKMAAYKDYHMVIVTPSNWLANLAKKSFMKNDDIRVINNGIDLSIFRPRTSDWKKQHHISKKFIVLGVSFEWSEKKGISTIIFLANHLGDDYQIVLVGTDDMTDKLLPNNIISIHRTNDQIELANIYSAADVLVNPTLEDTFPTVNMESIACGTPVVSFDTGGSPETIPEECGFIVEKGNEHAMLNAIISICEYKDYSRDKCLACSSAFDMHKRFMEYIELYNTI